MKITNVIVTIMGLKIWWPACLWHPHLHYCLQAAEWDCSIYSLNYLGTKGSWAHTERTWALVIDCRLLDCILHALRVLNETNKDSTYVCQHLHVFCFFCCLSISPWCISTTVWLQTMLCSKQRSHLLYSLIIDRSHRHLNKNASIFSTWRSYAIVLLNCVTMCYS